MSYETDLRNLLLPLLPAGSNVWPDTTEANAQVPYIIYQQVSGSAYWYMDNTLPGNRNARVQISAWSKSRLTTNDLIREIERTLCEGNPPFNVRPMGAFTTDYDDDLEQYGAMQDFALWYDNARP